MKQVIAKEETPVAVPTIRIIKIASCPTLSGKSTLSYQIPAHRDRSFRRIVTTHSGRT